LVDVTVARTTVPRLHPTAHGTLVIHERSHHHVSSKETILANVEYLISLSLATFFPVASPGFGATREGAQNSA